MVDSKHTLSLKEILDRYNFVLFDTSAIACPLNKSYDAFSGCQDKMLIEGKRIELINSFIKYLDSSDYHNNFFLTRGVVDELLQGNDVFSFKPRSADLKRARKVRNGGISIVSASLKSKRTPFYGTMRKSKSKGRSMVEILEAMGGILDLASTEADSFIPFKNEYRFLEYKYYHGRLPNGVLVKKKLSSVDFDLIGNIWVLSGTKDKVALISNDLPIMYSLERILQKDRIRRFRTSLFTRNDDDQYDQFRVGVRF